VLTGDQEIPPLSREAAQHTWEAPRDQWNIRVDSAVRNAFALTAIRYAIPVPRILELAPLLFVLAAEQSLERRRSHLAVLEEKLAAVTEAAADFHHLPHSIDPSSMAYEAIAAEENSIAARDILAGKLDDQLFMFNEPQKRNYEPDEDNPFVSDLKDMIKRTAATASGIALVRGFSRESADFEVCGKEALDLAAGDKELAQGFLSGWAPIHEMRDLLDTDQVSERIEWLRQKKAEHHESMRQLWIDLGLDDPTGGAGA
jgi:hypothetical protein